MNNKIKVLIVEDRHSARETIKNSLSRLNCDFSEAETGEKALSLIKKRLFDVIILDIKLSGIDGIETFIRAKKIRPNLAPVIILTGSLDTKWKTEADKLGALYYLTKAPLSIEKLRKAVIKATNLG